MLRLKIVLSLCLTSLFLASSSLDAEMIDFNSGFNDGDLVNTISTASGDVTFTFTDPADILTDDQPEISTGSGLVDSLSWRMRANNATNLSNVVSLLVSFEDLISEVNFTLGDIDRRIDGWQDIVIITGLRDGMAVGTVETSNLGSSVGRDTSSDNDYLTDNNATLFGSGDNNDGAGDTNGNVDVTFSDVIDSFLVEYRPGRNDDGLPNYGPKKPTSQFIRLGGLSFTAVPEPGSLILFGGAMLIPATFRRRRI